MFRNYLKIAFRHLWRQKGFTFINISGLAIGMAAFILIFMYIRYELSFDEFFENNEHIYRVHTEGNISQDYFDVAVSPPALGPYMLRDLPEVEAAIRIQTSAGNTLVANGDHHFYEEKIYYVDSLFFEVFSFESVAGILEEALLEPNSIVLTETIAKKYFGHTDVVGEVLKINNTRSFKVTAVLLDIPVNTHLDFEILMSFSSLFETYGREFQDHQDWGSISLSTYVLLGDHANLDTIQSRLDGCINEQLGELASAGTVDLRPYLMPLDDIHLHSQLIGELKEGTDVSYIYTMTAIALFILVIACINFMNLSTARSVKRSREVGMRRVCGSSRYQLVGQFLGESVIITLFGLIVSLILIEVVLPEFRDLTGLDLRLFPGMDLGFIIMLVGLVIFVGALSGLYPAFVLSNVKMVTILKGNITSGKKKTSLRNILVVVQFSISVILLISTGLIYTQMSYLRSKKLGFDKENVLVIPLQTQQLNDKKELLRNELDMVAAVEQTSFSSAVPGKSLNGTGYIPEGIDATSPWVIYTMQADHNFVQAMGFELVIGRDFSKDLMTDSTSILINEELVRRLNWEEPLGKKISAFGNDTLIDYKVIGVVKDYHFRSLHSAVEPSLIQLRPDDTQFIVIRLYEGNLIDHVNKVEEAWVSVYPAFPFTYFFLSEEFDQMYESEQKMGKLFIYFTIIAIVIACLGLFGLASYSAEQRRKEIGIRKVLGATEMSLIFRLAKEFTRWVILANVLAWPLAYLLIDNWLGNFAFSIKILYHTEIFVLAAIVSLVIAIVTVGYQALNASRTNPVDAIKYE